MNNKKDRITGGVLAVLAAAYIAASYSIKVFEGTGKTVINAGTIPRIWGACLLVLSLILLFRRREASDIQKMNMQKTDMQKRDVRKADEKTTKLRETESQKRTTVGTWFYENYAVVGTFLLMAVYIFLIDKVGYLLDTWIYLILQICLLSSAGKKNWLAIIIISTIVSAGTCYVFTHWLGVPLPPGMLTL